MIITLHLILLHIMLPLDAIILHIISRHINMLDIVILTYNLRVCLRRV